MKVYMKTTRDRYELPIAIADSPIELSRITNDDVSTIRSALCHVRSGRNKNSVYVEVEIGDLELGGGE